MSITEDVATIQADQARIDRDIKAHAYEVTRLYKKWESKVRMAEAAEIAKRDAGRAYDRAQQRHSILEATRPQLRREGAQA